MKVSRETLLLEANRTGFRPEVLEKVLRLIDLSLVSSISQHPVLLWKAKNVRQHRKATVVGLPNAFTDGAN